MYVDINIQMIQWSEQFSWGYQTPKTHNTAMKWYIADTEAMRMLHKRCANPPLHTCLGLCTMFWCVMDARNLNWNLPPGKTKHFIDSHQRVMFCFFVYNKFPSWFYATPMDYVISNRLPVFTKPFYPAVSLMAAASSSTAAHSHSDGDF